MKYVVIFLFVIAFAAFFVHNGYAAQCAAYTNDAACKAANCFWCDRCSSNRPGMYDQINNYGADRCVESSLNCTYSCSTLCGSQCQTDANCTVNLTDTDCFYSGLCSSCSCTYKQTDCPKPGTMKNSTCYYGDRQCGISGCSIRTCHLKSSEVCDPDDGCVSCGQDVCGISGEYVEEYKCVINDVFAKTLTYSCNATSCLYTKSDVFVKNCKNGCSDGKCNDEICNINGIQFDCNKYDGFYGNRFCKGNDVYQTYRDYNCASTQCIYTETDAKQESCSRCENGVCTSPTSISTPQTQNNTIPQIISNNTIMKPDNTPNLPTASEKRLYNGFFFGSNDININTERGRSGYVNILVTRSNHLGSLVIESGKHLLFKSSIQAGNYTVQFNSTSGNIRIYTTSSGWIFFMPAVYDVRQIDVHYK